MNDYRIRRRCDVGAQTAERIAAPELAVPVAETIEFTFDESPHNSAAKLANTGDPS
jgi:hypothetical protein